MTLPTNVTLPIQSQDILSGDPHKLYEYMRKLVYVVGTQIQTTNSAVNGTTTLITDTTTPAYSFIQGSTTQDTITYGNCILSVRRVNMVNYAWFDISWSAIATSTGNLNIILPYYSQNTILYPQICVIEPDNITFGAGYTYLTGNLLPNTNTIEIHQCGSGKPAIALPIPASGHIRGSIFYAGQQFQ